MCYLNYTVTGFLSQYIIYVYNFLEAMIMKDRMSFEQFCPDREYIFLRCFNTSLPNMYYLSKL
jgi:hypothetical protein